MSAALPTPLFFAPKVPVKRKHSVLSAEICRFCNYLQFCEDFEEVHAREARYTQRTEITGEPENYVITILTQHILRDGFEEVKDDDRLLDCRYCRFLYDALNLFFKDPSMDWIKDAKSKPPCKIRVTVKKGHPMLLDCYEAVAHCADFTHLRSDIEVFCHDRRNLTDSDFPSMELALPEPAHTPDDRECEGFIQRFFRGCGSANDSLDHTYFTPNRLLYIDWDNEEVTLWECLMGHPGQPDIPEKIEYATLSHCWFDTDPKLPKLLTSNLQDWVQGVSFSRLPRAVRDAVQVAHLNDIHWLWIDSLCIVQDSEHDRRTQLPLTGHYFRDSILTIVAASSTSPDEAFMHPPKEDWITKEIRFAAPSGADATIVLRRKYSRPVSPSDAIDESTTRDSLRYGSFRRSGPLYRRDRCFQESLLGTRVIHFTSAGVMFACKRHEWCTREYVRKYNRTDVFTGMLYPGRGRRQSALWLEAVQQYTARDVTNAKDRLSAISGLATVSKLGMQDRYLAGLWFSNLLEGLLWEVRLRPGQTNTTKITFPFDEQKAPTFSWASVNTKVVYRDTFDLEFVPDAKVTKTHSFPQHHQPCGAVDGAFITLEGRVAKCEVSQTLSGARGGQWQYAYFRNYQKGTKSRKLPFVADGSLVTVKGKNAVRDRSRKEGFSKSARRAFKKGTEESEESEQYPRRAHAYLTRYHYEFRKNMQRPKTTRGVAFVLCIGIRAEYDEDLQRFVRDKFDGLVLTRSMRYPGAFERIGCIRDVPTAALKFAKTKTITLV
ncbi:hypothetical protein V8C37DRAFT_383829 [Trichoderma ceciliae]